MNIDWNLLIKKADAIPVEHFTQLVKLLRSSKFLERVNSLRKDFKLPLEDGLPESACDIEIVRSQKEAKFGEKVIAEEGGFPLIPPNVYQEFRSEIINLVHEFNLPADWFFFVFDFVRYGIVTSFPISSKEKFDRRKIQSMIPMMIYEDLLKPTKNKGISLGGTHVRYDSLNGEVVITCKAHSTNEERKALAPLINAWTKELKEKKGLPKKAGGKDNPFRDLVICECLSSDTTDDTEIWLQVTKRYKEQYGEEADYETKGSPYTFGAVQQAIKRLKKL